VDLVRADPIAVGVGTQTLYLFPDRILVYAPNGVGPWHTTRCS
jgi:hypothetical protein